MRPILSLGLSSFLLMCSGCAADEFGQCLGAVSFREHEIPTVIEALVADEKPLSYVATKGVSMLGLYYLVVANYQDRTVVTMYRTGLGARSIDLSVQEGQDLYDAASYAISETPKYVGKGVFDRHNCHFVRAASGYERIDGKYTNPSHSESGNGFERVFYEFGSLLDAGYGEITYDSYTDQDIPIPPDYAEEELASIEKKNSQNIFRELDEFWLNDRK